MTYGHTPPIFQIVGYKNAGKTTVTTALITHFSEMGFKTGSLKHHGHGGEPKRVQGTDSMKHLEAGSAISAIQDEHMVQMTISDQEPIALETILKWYRALHIDILFLEGYKCAPFPKIVLLRNHEDLHLLNQLSCILAVGSINGEILQDSNFPTFRLDHLNAYLPQLATYIRIKLNL